VDAESPPPCLFVIEMTLEDEDEDEDEDEEDLPPLCLFPKL
jgi:hypothetical protein